MKSSRFLSLCVPEALQSPSPWLPCVCLWLEPLSPWACERLRRALAFSLPSSFPLQHIAKLAIEKSEKTEARVEWFLSGIRAAGSSSRHRGRVPTGVTPGQVLRKARRVPRAPAPVRFLGEQDEGGTHPDREWAFRSRSQRQTHGAPGNGGRGGREAVCREGQFGRGGERPASEPRGGRSPAGE